MTSDTNTGGMVVGVDGSAESLHALRWANARVETFGPVRPVTTWQYPWWMAPSPFPGAPLPPPAEQFQQEAERRIQALLADAGIDDADDAVVRRAHAGKTLVEVGADANLIVVGTRGRGAVADNVLGSTSCHVVSHATVPVAVVPTTAPIDGPVGRAVVGIDGSANSQAALVWALSNLPTETSIEAVHVWHYALSTLPEEGPIETEAFEGAARQTLDSTVSRAVEAAGGRNEIVRRLEFGDPRNVLGRLSESADLLVVGTQGHKGVAHLLMGSVTTGLTHQPSTTTVVVADRTG